VEGQLQHDPCARSVQHVATPATSGEMHILAWTCREWQWMLAVLKTLTTGRRQMAQASGLQLSHDTVEHELHWDRETLTKCARREAVICVLISNNTCACSVVCGITACFEPKRPKIFGGARRRGLVRSTDHGRGGSGSAEYGAQGRTDSTTMRRLQTFWSQGGVLVHANT